MLALCDVSLNNYEDIYYHLKKLARDESYIKYMCEMVEENNRKDPEETWYVIQQIVSISESNGYTLALAWGNALAGWFYLDRGNSMVAYDNFIKAHELFVKENILEGQVYCCNGIMMVYNHYGQFENAFDWGIRGMETAEDHDFGEKMFSISVNMASIFIDYEMYQEAESLIEKFFMSKLHYNIETIILRNNYKVRIKLALSLEYEALSLIDKTISIANESKINGLKYMLYLTKAEILSKLKQDKTAEEFYEIAYNYSVKYKNHGKDEILKKWGIHYLEQGKLQAAEQKLVEAESLARNSEKRFVLSKTLAYLTKLYELQKDYKKAYDCSKTRNQILSDILNDQTSKAISRASEKNTQRAVKSYKELCESINLISKTGKNITSELDMEKIHWILYEEISKLMKIDVVGICLYNEEKEFLEYEMFIERGEKIPGAKVKMGEKISFAEYCITRNCDLLIKNSHMEYNRYIPVSHISSESQFDILPKSLIYCPMVFAGKVTGVVTVQHYQENTYSYTDLSNIRLLTGYISIAVENSKLYKSARHYSTHDPLTGVYNRREIHSIGYGISKTLKKTDKSISIMMLDVDNFKSINDKYGHHTGDEVLKKIGELIKNIFDDQGHCGRYGGEEFMIIIPGKTQDEVVKLAEQVRRIIQDTVIEIKQYILSATVSIGIDISKSHSFNLAKSIARADNALYRAKQNGKNMVLVMKD